MSFSSITTMSCGRFRNAEEACAALVEVTESVSPDPALAALYEKKYRRFRLLYPALKETFKAIKED